MALVDVYDGAAMGSLSAVPSYVRAIVGYVSGPGAYHIWPTGNATSVRNTGREFWAIDVPPQRALVGSDGDAAANRMVSVLPSYGHPKTCPVFIDIEYNSYMASPAGADAAIARFKSKMKSSGYTRPHGYVPLFVGTGWGARYTNVRPSALPVGVVGVQYENDAYRHPGWDASVFDPSMFGNAVPPPPADPPETFNLGGVMADVEYVWWFGRQTYAPNHIYAVNEFTGQYQLMLNDHNMAVFKEQKIQANMPVKAELVDINGSMTQFGVEIKDAP